MLGRDSSRIRNGALIQWAYDQLALCREAGTLVRFRKVKAHRTDNSTDSKRNREANTLANQGRLMDLEEFGFPPDPLTDMEAEPAQPVLHPLDWDEVLADRIPPADSLMGVPLPAVAIPHPVPPMLSATQSDTTHPVPPSMHIHPVPCNDTHPKITSSSHSSASRPSRRARRHSPVPRRPRSTRRVNPKLTAVNLALHPEVNGSATTGPALHQSETGRVGDDGRPSPPPAAPFHALVPPRQRGRRLGGPSSIRQEDKVHQHNTHTGLARTRRDEEDRVGPDRPMVPIITADKEEPTDEVHPALNPGPDGTGTTGPASDRSDFGRPEAPEHTSPPPAMPPNAPGPQRQREQRHDTTRTGRELTVRRKRTVLGCAELTLPKRFEYGIWPV